MESIKFQFTLCDPVESAMASMACLALELN